MMSVTMDPPVMTDAINPKVDPKNPVRRVMTLGSVRHRDELTNEVILIPTPSLDPNDPLNWYVPKLFI